MSATRGMVIPRKRPTGSSKADAGKTGRGLATDIAFHGLIDQDRCSGGSSDSGLTRVWPIADRPPIHQRAITMNRTHLHRPTSRGSLFQWSVADRTVAACGIGSIGEQPQSELALTARIADNRGRFLARHDRRHMQRKVLLGRALRCVPDREAGTAEKKPRLWRYSPH